MHGNCSPPLPEWNPQTGFMASKAFGGVGDEIQSNSNSKGPATTAKASRPEPQISLGVPAVSSQADLPSVPKNSVRVWTCGVKRQMIMSA